MRFFAVVELSLLASEVSGSSEATEEDIIV